MRRIVPEMRSVTVTSEARSVDVLSGDRPLERMRGLIGRRDERGLLLRRTRSVHTFGMRRTIDVVLLDGDLVVVDVVRLRPRRILLPRRGVRHVLELYESPFAPGEALTVEYR
jgi:uncharacterized membrane protein (UPF0127 family)